MRLRKSIRRLVIRGATAIGLDAIERSRERLELRRGGTQLVRVFYLHGSPQIHAEQFRRQLARLREHFTVIDFEAFKALFEGSMVVEHDRPAALLTFDDGFASNYEVAAPLLEEAGMRGVFFVVPRFSASGGEEARRLYRERVRNVQPPFFQPPMTPEQIRDLSGRGHTIGNHTLSHARLSDVPEAEYEREIIESAAIIESWIGRPVEAFAWPFVWNAITPAAHRLACERHPYCFAPCAGRTDVRTDSRRLIWRTNIEPHYDAAEFRFQCSGLADHAVAARRRKLAQMLAR